MLGVLGAVLRREIMIASMVVPVIGIRRGQCSMFSRMRAAQLLHHRSRQQAHDEHHQGAQAKVPQGAGGETEHGVSVRESKSAVNGAGPRKEMP